MKMRLKIKNRLFGYDINKPRPKHGHKYTKYNICHNTLMLIYILSNILATIKARFMKKSSNTEAELKKSTGSKKSVLRH